MSKDSKLADAKRQDVARILWHGRELFEENTLESMDHIMLVVPLLKPNPATTTYIVSSNGWGKLDKNQDIPGWMA